MRVLFVIVKINILMIADFFPLKPVGNCSDTVGYGSETVRADRRDTGCAPQKSHELL